MEYRWLTNNEIEAWVNPVCEQMGWMKLNLNEELPTCAVLGAFDGVAMAAFLCLQLTAVIGPAWADKDHRDGSSSRALADRMHEHLIDVNCRGALTICEKPVSERLAERHGMVQVLMPVYQWIGV